MKSVIKVVSLCAILMLVTGSVYAFDNAYHVKQAPNGKGDLLIFPVYFSAPGGWETKVSVTNTSTVYSVVAKVVFRSHKYSQELLDFLIYLSPTDVWTATIKNNGTNTVVFSDDDSMLVSSSEFASKTNPVNQPLYTPQCPDDSSNYGYIEVIETWYGDVSRCYPAPTNSTWRRQTPGVSKYYLKQLYPTDGVGAQNAGWTDGTAVCNAHSAGLDQSINVLSGYMEIQNAAGGGMTSTLPATVFADFDVAQNMNVSEVSGLGVFQGANLLGEVEAAMSKNNVAMPYVNNTTTGAFTAHIFNFPTKLSKWTYSSTTNTCTYTNGTGPFWFDPAAPPVHSQYVCQIYSDPVYDLMENVNITTDIYSGKVTQKQMCQEVELLLSAGYPSLFNEGWTNYNFDYSAKTGAAALPTPYVVKRSPLLVAGDTNKFSFTGIPTIPVVLMFKMGGVDLLSGSYDDGNVYERSTPVAGSWYPEYQYFNYMPSLGLNNNLGVAGTLYPMAANPAYWDTAPPSGGAAVVPAIYFPNQVVLP